MYLGRVANMVLIYSYVEANKNSQTGVTGASAVLQEYVMAWSLSLLQDFH